MKHQENIGKMLVQGAFWSYLARFVGKPITLVSMVFLTRLLAEEDFGVAAYGLVVLNLLMPLNDFGVGAALIYHQEDEDAPHTAFWLGLCLSLGLWGLIWIFAPLAETIFRDERAIAVTRVLAFSLPLSSLINIHEKLLQKRLNFRPQVTPGFASSLGKGTVSIGLAVFGFGAWSLIGGRLVAAALSVIVYWWVFPWRPAWRFSRTIARTLLSYGRQLIFVNLLTSFLHNADYFIIGRVLGASMLGLYTVAFRVPELLILEFANVLGRVVFPVFVRSNRYNENAELAQTFLQTIRYVSLVILPLGFGLAAIARPFVLAMFSDKWVKATPILQAIAFYAALKALDRCAGNVFKTLGKLNILFRITVARGCLLIPALWWAATRTHSLVAIGWIQVIVALFTTSILFLVVGRTLRLSSRDIVHSLRPAVICSVALALAVWGVLRLMPTFAPVTQVAWAGTAGIVAYLTACRLQPDVMTQVRPLLQSIRMGG